MELKARKAGEKEFDKARKHSVEVFLDENAGNLICITDVGDIAVLPSVPIKAGKASPVWKAGMEVLVRKGGNPDFNEKTPKTGVEIFQDSNTGKLIYISDTGMIAAPATLTITDKDKAPEWEYGLDLDVRKAGSRLEHGQAFWCGGLPRQEHRRAGLHLRFRGDCGSGEVIFPAACGLAGKSGRLSRKRLELLKTAAGSRTRPASVWAR